MLPDDDLVSAAKGRGDQSIPLRGASETKEVQIGDGDRDRDRAGGGDGNGSIGDGVHRLLCITSLLLHPVGTVHNKHIYGYRTILHCS